MKISPPRCTQRPSRPAYPSPPPLTPIPLWTSYRCCAGALSVTTHVQYLGQRIATESVISWSFAQNHRTQPPAQTQIPLYSLFCAVFIAVYPLYLLRKANILFQLFCEYCQIRRGRQVLSFEP